MHSFCFFSVKMEIKMYFSMNEMTGIDGFVIFILVLDGGFYLRTLAVVERDVATAPIFQSILYKVTYLT